MLSKKALEYKAPGTVSADGGLQVAPVRVGGQPNLFCTLFLCHLTIQDWVFLAKQWHSVPNHLVLKKCQSGKKREERRRVLVWGLWTSSFTEGVACLSGKLQRSRGRLRKAVEGCGRHFSSKGQTPEHIFSRPASLVLMS